MKKQLLLVLLSSVVSIVVLTSSSTGPAHTDNLNRSASGCGGTGCHSNTNSNNTFVAISLTDKTTGITVSDFKYTPGKAYRLKILGGNLSGLAKFGFQITCVQKAAQTIQAGVFANWQSGVWSKTISGVQVVEHAGTLNANSTGIDSVMMDWTAPAASAGTVRFNYMLNAVNGSNTTGGDEWNGSLSEYDPIGTGVQDRSDRPIAAVFPNPAVYVLHLSLRDSENHSVRITDAAGKVVLQQQVQAVGGKPVSISVAWLPAGIYQLILEGGSSGESIGFVKQ